MQTPQAPASILLIEDDPDDQLLINDMFRRHALARHFRLDIVDGAEPARRSIARHHYAACLVDYRLGAESGLELIRDQSRRIDAPPMIMLTGVNDDSVDHRAQAAGAADYLVKADLRADELERVLRYVIERHRMTREIAVREAHYRALFEANPLPMWVFDPISLAIRAVNEAAIKQYGWSREEFMKLRISDLRRADEVPKLLDFLALPEASVDRAMGVWEHCRKDGSLLQVEVTGRQIQFEGASARLVLALDVTKRLDAERSVRESAATLHKVLNDVSDGLMVIDANRQVMFANRAMTQLLGSNLEEIQGQPAPAQLMGDAGELELRDVFETRHHVLLSEAETQWNGAPARVITIRDLSERHAHEQQLHLLSRAIEANSAGVVIADARAAGMPLTYVNAAFQRITGYSAAEVLGRNCRFLQGDDREQPGLVALRKAIENGTPVIVELRNYRKDGSLFWNQLSLSPVLDSEGKIGHFIGIQNDVTEQKRLESERNYLLTHDPVTRLPKHMGAEGRLEVLLEEVRRQHGARLAVVIVDLDGFHTVNDTMGYAMGDEALKQTAERLRDCAGPHAEVLRYAADEFLVAIPAIDEDLLVLGTRFCECIAEPMPISVHATLYLTASVGVSGFPDAGNSIIELTRQADLAMNRAKRSGRNCAFVFSAELSEALSDRLMLGGRMRQALVRNEFVLHFQPQVNTLDGSVIGLEALVRWNSPELGLLPPRRFIPVAEDNGMILHLGAWVLRSACRQLRAWIDQGLSGFLVSVNVSAAQMQRPDFVSSVRAIIEETGIEPAMLELELTESVLMDHAERAILQMTELKQLGIRLAIDDFGVGYSSLSYLRRFPIDKLKIDQAFIRNLAHDDRDAALVRAMIAMGHHLGMLIVAEGVEEASQYGYLKRHHCDQCQGHWFSEPVPAAKIPELLNRRFLLPWRVGDQEQEQTLLLLDDEDNIRRALTRLLRRDGYKILSAGSAAEAFELLATNRVQVIISDQRMPGMSGTEFLSRVKAMYPDTIRMVLSGYTDLATVTEAINRGAIYKFLTKPWDDDALRQQVQEAFRRYQPGIERDD